MFWWFKKQKQKNKEPNFDFEDTIESTLWDVKEEYDLETEEVERTVFQKRKKRRYINCFFNCRVQRIAKFERLWAIKGCFN